MIELNAEISFGEQTPLIMKSITSNIPDINGNSHLIFPYTGSLNSDSSGRFGNTVDAEEKVEWVQAKKTTFFPQGRVEYNGEMCISFAVAYVFELNKNMSNISYAEVLDYVISGVQDGKMYAVPNFSFEKADLGLWLDVYITQSYAEELVEVMDLLSIMPSVKALVKYGHEKYVNGKHYVFDVESDEMSDNISIYVNENEYGAPLYVVVDGIRYNFYKGSSKTITGLSPSTTRKIVVEAVRSPFEPLVIKSIVVNSISGVKISRENAIRIETSIFDRSDISQPSFGIFSNDGRISFVDQNGIVLLLANNGVDLTNSVAKIFLNDTLKKSTELVGTYYATDWEYDNNNRSVSVSLKDDLEKLQDVSFLGFNQRYETNNNAQKETIPLSEAFKQILEEMNSIGFNVDSASEEKLLNTLGELYIDFPHLNEGSLWAQLEKFCKVLNMRVYKSNQNLIVFDF